MSKKSKKNGGTKKSGKAPKPHGIKVVGGEEPKAKDPRASLLNAAHQVLTSEGAELNCKAIVERAVSQKLWEPGAGKTPEATLHAAISREIKTSDAPRFKKGKERGTFAVAG